MCCSIARIIKEAHISNNIPLGHAQQPQVATTGDAWAAVATKGAARFKARTKKMNFTLLTSQIVVLAGIIGIVAVSYRAPIEGAAEAASRSVLDQPVVSVDQIAAAHVATAVAQVTDLSVERNVASLSISLNTKTELAQTDNTFLSKPQIVAQTGRKDIIKYSTQSGDTVQSLAAKFGVSEDTIRWANNLTSDSLTAGKELSILGTTGIIYTIKSGDDAAKLADKYKADKDRIVTFNDAELSGLQVGSRIIIPDGILPESERPGYVSSSSLATYSSPSVVSSTNVTVFGGNGYAYGYCTWYAFNRRAELGSPVGSNWGNAVSWADYARAAGFVVDRTPAVGAVLQNGGGYGHVAIVERVNEDGSVFISEMNYAGWNVISNRTIPSAQVSSYNYIH